MFYLGVHFPDQGTKAGPSVGKGRAGNPPTALLWNPNPRPLAMFLVSLQLCSSHLRAKAEARHTQEQYS